MMKTHDAGRRRSMGGKGKKGKKGKTSAAGIPGMGGMKMSDLKKIQEMMGDIK